MTEPQSADHRTSSRLLALTQAGFAGLSLTFGLAIAVCYGARWPAVVAVTIFPVWAWLFPGLIILSVSHSATRRRRTLLIAAAWSLIAWAFSEEPRGALTCSRPWPAPAWQQARARGEGLRVVTVNCAGGNADVAREGLAYEPDILLLQESPPDPELADAVDEHLSYAFVRGPDASIVVHGEVKPIVVARDHRSFVTVADAEVAGLTVRVINTRLLLPYCELDLWRPGAWRAAREAYGYRAEQMEAVRHYLDETPAQMPVVVGGDFNAPVGDRLFRAFRPRLRDAYPERPIGLGNTIMNEFPLARIDQVWVSPSFRVHAVVTRRTQHSDHRLVICDLSLREAAP